MSTIVTRAGKGSPLTHTEVDTNFTNLNTDKAEDSTVVKLSGDQTISGTKTFSSTISGSINGNAATATNGVVTTGSYANPSWITSLDDGKVLPSMSGNSGKYLTTDGTDSSWGTVAVSAAAVSDQANTSTGYFDLPAGTTAQRPASPATGMVRYNTTLSLYEAYSGTDWVELSTEPLSYSVEYLVVAGGGAGGGNAGGGGGAGGYRASSLSVDIGTGYTVTVGAGGSGNTGNGGSGNNSVFGSITSTGGGGGGGLITDTASSRAGASGGSGGGGGGTGNDGSGAASGGSGTSGQGNSGGTSGTSPASCIRTGGGGGGSSGAGGNASGQVSGGGGIGTTWSNGSPYAGGGGGGNTPYSIYGCGADQAGSAGNSGGGNGGSGASGSNATANTGSGGGGGGFHPSSIYSGGNGGSGIVVIRYSGSQRGTGGTVSSSGGYTYHTFTSSGTYTA